MKWACKVRTSDMTGNPQRDFIMIVEADTSEEAAERIGLSHFDRNAKVEVYTCGEEPVGTYWIEKRTTVTTRVVSSG